MNLAGMVAENICRGLLNPVSWEQSYSEDVFRIDTRDTSVFQADPIPGMNNIPLGNIRESEQAPEGQGHRRVVPCRGEREEGA